MTDVSNVFYHHTRLPDENFNPASHGGISYAFVIDQNEQAVHVGVSVCSLKDNFNKKFGRTTAEDRLKAYLNGTPVLTAKDDTGLQYPMAFSVGVQDVVSVLHVEGVLAFLRDDIVGNYFTDLRIQDVSIGALIGVITTYHTTSLLPFLEK